MRVPNTTSNHRFQAMGGDWVLFVNRYDGFHSDLRTKIITQPNGEKKRVNLAKHADGDPTCYLNAPQPRVVQVTRVYKEKSAHHFGAMNHHEKESPVG